MKNGERFYDFNGGNELSKIKHGGCGTDLYNVWKTMRQRCYNPNCTDFRWYGARGISVCNEWDDFTVFREWAYKSGYKKGLTIDRIDGDKSYCEENCCWKTIEEQQSNKSNVIHFTYNGSNYTVDSACKKFGITKQMFYDRKHKGWDIERILTTPKITKIGGYRKKGVFLRNE